MMYLTMPFLAVATATLAQDRLLTDNVATLTPVEKCDGAVLQQKDDDTQLKCRFASQPTFEAFDEWTTSEYIERWGTDEMKTPSGSLVDCTDVCMDARDVWQSGSTSCALTVDWLKLKQAAHQDLRVDLNMDANGLAGDKDENMEAAMAIVEQMKAQFGLSGSNQEIGEDLQNGISGLSEDEIAETARQTLTTAMNTNQQITEWIKTYGVAFVSYILHRPPSWFANKLGLVSSDDRLVISEEIKQQGDKIIDWLKTKVDEIEGMGYWTKYYVKNFFLGDIQTHLANDTLTNNVILAKIKKVQGQKNSIEKAVAKEMCLE